MQQHTVPRDIGSQEFKLVGSMTLRQFLMLLGGIITAYTLFLLPIHPFLKWPPVVISIFFGFAFAFMPIQERSLDHWILAFIKAVTIPSQRVWRQAGIVPEFLTLALRPNIGPPRTATASSDRSFLAAYVRTLPATHQTSLDIQEEAYLGYLDKSLQRMRATKPAIAPTDRSLITIAQSRTPLSLGSQTLASTINFTQQKAIKLPTLGTMVQVIPGVHNVRIRKLHYPAWVTQEQPPPAAMPVQQETVSIKPTAFFVPTTSLAATPISPAVAPASLIQGESSRAQAETELLRSQQVLLGQHIQELEEKLAHAREKAPATPSSTTSPSEVKQLEQELSQALVQKVTPRIPKARGREIDLVSLVPLQKAQPIQTTTAVAAKPAAMPALSNLPNAINGVVYGPSGELLPNVIIVIKDEQGVPVRALKTNRLGQFVVATPLPNGAYFIELEKDGFLFDIIKTTITGAVLSPIAISARSAQGSI